MVRVRDSVLIHTQQHTPNLQMKVIQYDGEMVLLGYIIPLVVVVRLYLANIIILLNPTKFLYTPPSY